MTVKAWKKRPMTRVLAATLCLAITLLNIDVPVLAQNGSTYQTPPTPMEQPIEVEIEVSPAGTLKQVPLWKEIYQLLVNPSSVPATTGPPGSGPGVANIVRRPSFRAVPMPPLLVLPLDHNFLIGERLRIRTSDGEVSLDREGLLFDTDEVVDTDPLSTPTELRTPIGALVEYPLDPTSTSSLYQRIRMLPPGQRPIAANLPGIPEGSLVVINPGGNSRNPNSPRGILGFGGNGQDPSIPPHLTVVAVPAVQGGVLQELDGESTTATVPLEELEIPVNEEDFFRDPAVHGAVSGPLAGLEGRPAAEILGKALFWDMQVGSDGVQACGSCHFHAGVDNRTKAQLNPGINAGDTSLLDVHINAGRPNDFNQEVVANDFPFHKRVDPDVPGDGFAPGIASSDANDVMSSMGVSRFKLFVDVPVGGAAFIAGTSPGVLAPDFGTDAADPVAINEGFRRVEPRHTPTFHNAAYNLDNFWDGRARFVFNGGSVQGPADPQFHIFVNDGTTSGALHGLPHPGDVTREESLDLWAPDPGEDLVPARIKFSSLASQAAGPPLSDFEMSFSGRNWPKIAKKLLQAGVTPLANQMVSPTDSVLGAFANPGGPGLTVTYNQLIEAAFDPALWANTSQHFDGAPVALAVDPFDGFVLSDPVVGAADPANTLQFSQMEANFTLLFGLAVQAYESLTIADDTLLDQFMDVNPFSGQAVGEPADQAVLFPTLIPDLLADGQVDGNTAYVNLIPDNPATPEYDGFGPDEVFGWDVFTGSNLTAGLAPGQSVANNLGGSGRDRNPLQTITTQDGQVIQIRVGSNPFTRSAKCMLCHLGPEQSDHTIANTHGLQKFNAEFEYPTPPVVGDPDAVFAADVDGPFAGQHVVPAPEPSGNNYAIGGLILSEEVSEGMPQDAVEVEPRNFATFDDPATPWDDRIIGQQKFFAFGDQGIYNLGIRPTAEDIGRGGPDAFGWPLSSSALTLKNIGGADFEPNDSQFENNVMLNFDPENISATFEETGDGVLFPGLTHDLQSINPGYERGPMNPQLPAYLSPWVNDLPAGELHPQIDEMAGLVPNTITPTEGGPLTEFPEVMFGADTHCALYDPARFGSGPPNFGWGAPSQTGNNSLCPHNQSGVAGNFGYPVHGTWPVPNRVLREGAFKAPGLRNIELTAPYFHTGSYLTLRQVVDFYFRGGDFPITNEQNRDPNINDLFNQAFSYGTSKAIGAGPDGVLETADDIPSTTIIDQSVLIPGAYTPGVFFGTFADGLPDTQFLYDQYPDSDHPFTPEPTFASRAAAIEDVKVSLVKFLIALTDPRVRYERAPFDRPQIFVPVDGTAPDNTGGPAVLAADVRFLNLPAVGAVGNATPLQNFMNLTTIPPGNAGYNCSSSAGPVSHHCAVVTP